MVLNWRVQDSLIAEPLFWKELSNDGFDFVIANPPWEKLKLTKHEYQKDKGVERHYSTIIYKAIAAGVIALDSSKLGLKVNDWSFEIIE